MVIQQLSCDFNHLSIPVHLGPCRSHLCSRTSTEGAAVITGTGWRRGGGPATWARWSMARASASTLDGPRGLSAPTVSITPPPGHYEPGAVGLHRRLPKGAPTSGVGPDGGLANEPHKEPRGAPGDWHPKTL